MYGLSNLSNMKYDKSYIRFSSVNYNDLFECEKNCKFSNN